LQLPERVAAGPAGDVGDRVGRGVESGAGADDVGDGLDGEFLELLGEPGLAADQGVGELVK
jgi:hypothetical protein